MNRRFWAALGVGVLAGAGAVAGFGPYVRAQIDDRAERYGLEVSVGGVMPTLAGVRLEEVEVTIPSVPGVSMHLDSVIVGWGDRRPKSTVGGRIEAVGSVAGLLHSVDGWRKEHLSGGGSDAEGGGGRALELTGFELHWRDRDESSAHQLDASGLGLVRADGTIVVSAERMVARGATAELELTGGSLALERREGRYRLIGVATRTLALQAGKALEQLDGGAKPTPVASAASSATVDDAPTQPATHRRVAAVQRLQSLLRDLAGRLDGALAEDADIDVRGARAQLAIGGDTLNLGPGALSVVREHGDLVLALEPEIERGKAQPLTFSVRLPVGKKQAAVSGELRGGPLGLSLLGVKEGDLGLRDVDRTTIECDLKVSLPADGEKLSVDGRGKLHKLSIASKRLAEDPLKDVELAWRLKADLQLDGSRVDVAEGEVDLGAIRGLFHGNYQHAGDAHKLAFEVEMPLVSCQQVFDSIPSALVPKLVGMRFAGSLSMKGHVRFDTARLDKSYDVDWDGSNSCRITSAPPDIHPDRFKTRFSKLVYTPEGDERTMEFGPETETWIPIGAISHFMEGAVLTTEDGRFFRHHGFDQEAIVNSLRENLRTKRFTRGASTISMQLAKNLYLPRTKTISRKLQEAVLTMYLEQELTKREMMELYLNVIEYGPMIYGIGPAAQHYFNSSPSRLSLGQSLYLASILSNPKEQHFGAGGAVTPQRMAYLHTLMKIVHKIGRISDEELDEGMRETVVYGSPSIVAPSEDDVEEPKGDPLEEPPPAPAPTG